MGDEDGSFTELANLKKRLESLGVKIRSGLSDETNTVRLLYSFNFWSALMENGTCELARCRFLEASTKMM